MSDIQRYLNKQLQNDEFKKEWHRIQPELNKIDVQIVQKDKDKHKKRTTD